MHSTPFPFKYREEFQFLKKDSWISQNTLQNFDSEIFKYQLTTLVEQNKLTITFLYESLENEVRPEQVDKHRNMLLQVRDESSLRIFNATASNSQLFQLFKKASAHPFKTSLFIVLTIRFIAYMFF